MVKNSYLPNHFQFHDELDRYWHRKDIVGKLSRQLLLPPMVAQTFDKSSGVSVLKQTELPPRVCLRSLASISSVSLSTISLFLGYLLWGAPSYGLFLLLFFAFIVIFLKAIVFNV